MSEDYNEYFANEKSENESESEDDSVDFWEFENDESPELVTDDSSFVNLPPAAKIPKIEGIRHWISGAFEPRLFSFDETNSGICEHMRNENELPLYWFECFFDTRLMDVIVGETNRYHESIPVANDSNNRKHQKDWVPVHRKELYRFLALVMLMSVVKKATLKCYWSTDPLLATPIFADVMARDRFLHFNDNDEQPAGDRLFKIEPVMNILREKFTQFVIPSKNLWIDESLMLWKGRLAFKQYIPNKRHRFGVKFYIIVDCKTGVILDFIIYVGSETEIHFNEGLGISWSIVMTLMEPYLGKGHNLYVDNWYTSPKLFDELHKNQTGACGTVRLNRSGMPTFNALKKSEVEHLHDGCLLAIKWHDKRDVHMLTTINKDGLGPTKKKDHHTNATIEKPLAVIDYNANMGGVDKSDMQIWSNPQNVSIHFVDCSRKTKKWYKKVFFHMLDVAVFNAYNMYRIKNKKKQTLGEFRLRQLIEKYGENLGTGRRTSSNHHPKRLIDRHFSSLIPYEKGQSVRKERKRSKTRYECIDCNVGLCVADCFKEYHTLLHF